MWGYELNWENLLVSYFYYISYIWVLEGIINIFF